MTALELAEILGRHLLIAGNGYHRTSRCTCGWKTREAAAGDAHRLHVAEVVLGGDRQAAMAAARAALRGAASEEESNA